MKNLAILTIGLYEGEWESGWVLVALPIKKNSSRSWLVT